MDGLIVESEYVSKMTVDTNCDVIMMYYDKKSGFHDCCCIKNRKYFCSLTNYKNL